MNLPGWRSFALSSLTRSVLKGTPLACSEACSAEGSLRGGNEGDPFKGALLNRTCGSLEGDLIERVYIPKGPPNPDYS